MNNEIDVLLDKAGRSNKYQYLSLLLLFILYGTSEYLVIILPFLEAKPKVEFYDTKLNSTIITTINYTICDIFEYKVVEDLTKHSLIYDLNIYCDKTLTITLGTCLFSGIMIGSSIAYIFADRKGRKITMIFFSLAFFIVNIIFYFTYILIPVFLLIFLAGLFSSIVNITILVYVSEMVQKQNLIIYTSTIFCAFSFFGTIYATFIFYFAEWRVVLLIVLLILLIVIPLIYFYIEESPIFFISHGKEGMFLTSVQNIAKKNGRKLEETDLTLTNDNEYNSNDFSGKSPFGRKESSDSSKESHEGLAILTSPILRDPHKIHHIQPNKESNESSSLEENDLKISNTLKKQFTLSRTCIKNEKQKRKMINDYSIFDLVLLESQRTNFLILCYIWVVVSVIFYGLSINIKNFYGNIYFQYFIIFFCDMICSFIGGLLSNHQGIGRKKAIILLLLVSYCSFMTSIFFDQDPNSFLFSICLNISRISLIALNCIIYCYTNEIYPTVLRTKGLGVSMTIGKLGAILAPYIIENLDSINLLMIFCILNLFAIIFSFMLPETLTRRMAFQPPEMSGIIEDNFD